MSVRVWLVRVAAIVLALALGALAVAAFYWVLINGLAAGMENRPLNPTESYVEVRLKLGGLFPAALGTVASLLLLPNRRAPHKAALALVGAAGLLVVVFGPLMWSPPDPEAPGSFNPWIGGDNWFRSPFWWIIAGLVLVAGLSWYRLRLPVERSVPRAPSPRRPRGRDDSARRSIGETLRGARRFIFGENAARTAAYLLIFADVGGLMYGGWSIWETVAYGALVDQPALAWGGAAWMAVSLVPSSIGLRRLVHQRSGALLFLGIGALAAVAGALMHSFSWSRAYLALT